jgi:hypothetical protein
MASLGTKPLLFLQGTCLHLCLSQQATGRPVEGDGGKGVKSAGKALEKDSHWSFQLLLLGQFSNVPPHAFLLVYS